MMNKRGVSTFIIWTLVVLAAVVILVWLFGGFSKAAEFFAGKDSTPFSQKIEQTIGFDEVYGSTWGFLNYIFGEIPKYVADATTKSDSGKPFSAAIIIIGLWFLLFLSFSDVIRLFGTFSSYTSWIIAGVLALIAANVKLLTVISVAMLSFTAVFGAFSVFAGIVVTFIIFLGIQFGSEQLRVFAEKRKITEMRIRAMSGSAKAQAGLKAMKDIGEAVSSN